MANTPNYNLKKVEYTEIADIPGHFNANFDTIDTVMKNNADAVEDVEDELVAHKAENMPHPGPPWNRNRKDMGNYKN